MKTIPEVELRQYGHWYGLSFVCVLMSSKIIYLSKSSQTMFALKWLHIVCVWRCSARDSLTSYSYWQYLALELFLWKRMAHARYRSLKNYTQTYNRNYVVINVQQSGLFCCHIANIAWAENLKLPSDIF